jgi:hypothetical protein
VRNILLLYISHPVYGILLQQREWNHLPIVVLVIVVSLGDLK